MQIDAVCMRNRQKKVASSQLDFKYDFAHKMNSSFAASSPPYGPQCDVLKDLLRSILFSYYYFNFTQLPFFS